ncbi:hypothetical protein Glove_19g217 [Diversispora epigaea]|uniref:Uncharacterized protein n=1 Tax=Diversispora epigaea TaxID=1348612 RepID=A0A397JST1_9GLOM|nr:hypothetical protein Glove_19g217 [Diversispora epigaea]
MFSIIHSQVQQQLPSTLSPSTSVLEFPKRRSFNFLRYHVPKFKINYAKYYENENLVVKYCTQYLDNFPLSYSTLCNRAETFEKLKRYDEALNDLNHAITCLPLKWRAFCYYEIHLYIHALWDLDLIINSGYADAFTYLNRADINRRLKRFVDANEDITKAFWFKNVNKVFTYGIRGELKLDCEEFQDAIDDLNKVLNFQPDNVTALRNWCKSHKILIDMENALNDLNELCILEPENCSQYELKGAILLDMRKYEDSLKNLSRAIESLPNNVITIAMDLYHRKHQYNTALHEAEVILMIDHKNINMILIRADIYFLKRKYNYSLADLDNANRIAPKNSFVLVSRSELFCKIKYYKDALRDVQSALEIKSANQYALKVCGNIYRKLHKYQEALVDFNKSLELYPLDMILEHHQNQDGRKKGCKVGGGKDGKDGKDDINEDDKDDQNLLVCKNRVGYDKGFVVTQQIFGERNFSRIYYRRGATYSKLGMYELALEDFNQLYPLDMILEHHQNQDGRKKGCKVGGGKDGKDGKDDINEDDKDDQNLLVCKNRVGYDKGFVVTQQIFGERNFSRIYYRRGATYSKLGIYELALEDFNRALELANGYAPIYKKRAYVLRKLENLDDTYKY